MHEEIAGDEAAALADRASFDGSAGGERLRRSQTARSRELRQTLELLMKMQKGENNGQAAGDDGKMKDGDKCRGDGDGRLRRSPRSSEDHASLGRRRRQRPGSAQRTSLVRWRRWRW